MDKITSSDETMVTVSRGIRQNFPILESDYVDSDGFIVCGDCHTRKERDVTIQTPEGRVKVYEKIAVACECGYNKFVEAQARKELEKIEERREWFIADSRYRSHRFEIDDSPESDNSTLLRAYVKKWDKMFALNKGMVFNGTMGTGKSFYACCIANELIDRGDSAMVITISKLRLMLTDNAEKNDALYAISSVSLLVLDDFGTESRTETANSITNLILDTRCKSGKPLIITTNLTMEQFYDSKIVLPRVRDRIINEMCPVWLTFTGESRREYRAERSRQEFYNLLNE